VDNRACKDIIAKELPFKLAQGYHSKGIRPNASKETIRADESRLGADRKSSAPFGWANFEHVLFYRASKEEPSKPNAYRFIPGEMI